MWRRMAEDRQIAQIVQIVQIVEIGGWSHRSHRLQLRVLCLSMRHKWSAARLSAAIGGGPQYLSLTPPFSLCMTMSMTNHGQHVKNLSWNIWAVNLAAASRRRNRVPLLVDFVFLKLVHKYCYKCVESKQLETNERSTGFPAFRLPLARPQVGCLQFMNHLKDEGPTRVTHSRPNAEPNHLSTQIQLEHATEGSAEPMTIFPLGNMTNINKQLTKY